MGREKEGPAAAAAGGCMSGMLHFFDFHHLLFSTNSSTNHCASTTSTTATPLPFPSPHHPSHHLKGVEAPRNSLELEGSEEYYGIPKIQVGVQMVSAPSKKKKQALLGDSEEKRSLQGADTPRTPNVVARLMGLEILPDDGASYTPPLSLEAPKSSRKIAMAKKKKKEQQQCIDESCKDCQIIPRQPLRQKDCNILPANNARLDVGFRSLPETPRVSSERSRDGERRLSFQLNKENYGYESLPPSPSKSHNYAREIVKQLKEGIGRRESTNPVITGSKENILRSRRSRPTEAQKASRVVVDNEISKKSSSSSEGDCSAKRSVSPLLPSSHDRENTEEKAKAKAVLKNGSNKCKKPCSYERFTERIKRKPPPPTPEASQDLFSHKEKMNKNISIPSFIRTSTRIREASHHDQLLHSSSIIQNQEQKKIQRCESSPMLVGNQTKHHLNQFIAAKEQNPEFQYVSSILERAGITCTPPPQHTWFSPSLPIDPFIFHQLELEFRLFEHHHQKSPLRHHCNRKLLFHVVEEILGDLLISHAKHFHRRLHSVSEKDQVVLARLWSEIRRFPSADCKVIGDIDALVAGDMAEAKVRRLLEHPSVAAEAKDISLRIEQDVLDSVIGEVAASLALSVLQTV